MHSRAAALALALAAACAPAEEPGAGVAGVAGAALARGSAHTTIASLLQGLDLEGATHPDGVPPRIDLAGPGRAGIGLPKALPSLILTGSSAVELPVPQGPPERLLTLDLAPTHDSWLGGTARVTLTLDGAALLETELPLDPGTPLEERLWQRHRLALPAAGGVLRLAVDAPEEVQLAAGRLTLGFDVQPVLRRRSEEQPGLVLVVIDTLRADRLGSHGYARPTSPVLDALAERGRRFVRAYSAGPWTLPGTASILTGASPPEHGVGATSAMALAHALDTVAEVAQRQGVRTAGFAMNPLISAGNGFDQGFDRFETGRWTGAPEAEAAWHDWIAGLGDEQFFLYVHLVEPHFPYTPSAEACEALGIAPAAPLDQRDLRPLLQAWYEQGAGDWVELEALARRQSELYDAEVWDADAAVGRLLDSLEARGVLDETVVCVTSDHGEEFLEHGWAQHDAQLWDESVHVPLLLAGPGVPMASRAFEPIENRHLAGTLLALGGLEGPEGTTSRNLEDLDQMAVLRAEGAFGIQTDGWWPDPLGRRLTRLGQAHALRRGPWQLISCPNSEPPGAPSITRLHHVARDPEQSWDLSSEQPLQVREMQEDIEAWLQEGLERRPEAMPSLEAVQRLLQALGY